VDTNTAKELIKGTFNYPFEETRFRNFAINLLNDLDEDKNFGYISGNYIKDKFKPHITKYRRLGTYIDPNDAKIDVLVVQIKNEWALERSRSMLRNFTADYLSNRDAKDAALVAYFSSDPDDWRFSYIRMEYKLGKSATGKVTVRKDLTPAKRFSFLVGKNEPNHTAQSQLLPILEDDRHNPTLKSLESAFSVDKVTKQFYQDYRGLYEKLKNELDHIVQKDKNIATEFEYKSVTTSNFAKKLMGQIVFLYFLQKKGWLGVSKNVDGTYRSWGEGPKNFLKRLLSKDYLEYDNFHNDVLEPLFYEALAKERVGDVYDRFDCKIPFLNGGLFEPVNDYNWLETDINIDNNIFVEIIGTFDQYNFTVREDEPLETEVAVDPEMLGKVFENLIEENEKKGKGTFYTPRVIVHYMCQESLINYLTSACSDVPKDDIATLIREGDIILELETAINEGTDYQPVLMDAIKSAASELDEALAKIKICDPAVGSGAFPVGMLNEIVKARRVLQIYTLTNHTAYELKRHTIQNSLYGVDIDAGATEIAKLRLWLSLVVDENDYNSIQPLPNLDYKIMQGNSLIEEFHGISLDIEKKTEQLNAFSGGSPLDELIEDLHNKQADFFNAEHPHDKKNKRQNVETAINNVFGHELEKKKSLSPQEANEIEADLKEMTHGNKMRNFFPWKLYFADVFREKGGFDVIIANPPYVLIGKREFDKSYKGAFPLLEGKPDLYRMFLEKSLSTFNKGGVVSFIIPNTLLSIPSAKKLRNSILTNYQIDQILSFEKEVFESASVNNIVIIIENNNSNRHTNIYYVDQTDLNANRKNILQSNWLSNSERFEFDIFVDSDKGKIIDKIEDNSIRLGDLTENITLGLQAYHNTIHSKKQIESRFLHSNKKTDGGYLLEFGGKNIMPFYVKQPTVKKYVNYAAELYTKPSIEYFSDRRLIVREIFNKKLNAVITDDNFAVNKSCFVILTEDEQYTLEYILGIISSSLIAFWIDSKGDKSKQRLFPRISMHTLKSCPIVKVKNGLNSIIESKVEAILDSKRDNPQADTTSLESEIDQLVYKLYNLTDEEITILEASINKK
jgi:adenine-specific DNA-methyltransferase